MLRHITLPLIALTVLIICSSAIAQTNFSVNLTHAQETAQGAFTTSTGGPRPESFGTADFVISADNSTLTFTSTIFNIDVNGLQTPDDTNDNLGAAHIHVGAPLGMNAGVRWGFFGAPDNDIAPDDLVVTPFATGVGGTFSSKWDAGEGNSTTLADQLPGILAGLGYINFHTTQFGGGEIRGQMIIPEPASVSLLALSSVGLLRRRNRA